MGRSEKIGWVGKEEIRISQLDQRRIKSKLDYINEMIQIKFIIYYC